MCANLKQLGFPVQFVYGNLDWQLAENQLLGGIWTSFATRYLKKAKVGLIGYQAPGFQVRSKRLILAESKLRDSIAYYLYLEFFALYNCIKQ